MGILLAIIIYMIISFSVEGGDGFSWIMLIGFIITFIITFIIMRIEMDDEIKAQKLDIERRTQEYRRRNNIK